MKNWPAAGVTALLHELYELSNENRQFLHARLLTEASSKTLDDAKDRLAKIVSTSTLFRNQFRHSDAKRIVDQYEKATDDSAAVAELLLLDVELSFSIMEEVGDCEELVDHSFAVIGRMYEVFEKVPPERLTEFVDRASKTAKAYSASFGYGISDEYCDFAATWRERTDHKVEN
jgi:hypothetical protein